MLAADKLMLEASIRQSAMSLKEKEFLLHHDNLTTVGTQAAVMAGFSVTALIEFGPPSTANRVLKFFYYNAVMIAMAANILCVVQTTCLSVKGTSLAMRGPYGSVAKAVDGMYAVRRQIFALFGVGMLALFIMAILGSWLILDAFSASVATCIVSGAIYTTLDSYRFITCLFHFDEAEAVSFDDLLTRFKDPPVIASRSSSISKFDDFQDDDQITPREDQHLLHPRHSATDLEHSMQSNESYARSYHAPFHAAASGLTKPTITGNNITSAAAHDSKLLSSSRNSTNAQPPHRKKSVSLSSSPPPPHPASSSSAWAVGGGGSLVVEKKQAGGGGGAPGLNKTTTQRQQQRS